MSTGSTSRHAAHAQVLYDPLADGPASYKTYLRWTKRRSTVRLLFALVCVATLLLLGATKLRHPTERLVQRIVDPPPLYGEWHRAELALPQHDAAKAFDGGKKYLLVNNHVAGLGWGNFLEDMIMNAQVAYSSGRAFVFDNFTWDRDRTDYSKFEFNGNLIPAQVPLSALISGPLVGGPMPEEDHTPLSVHMDFFRIICPKPTIVDTQVVWDRINNNQASAISILAHWVDYLNTIEDPCVEISRYSERIFDYYIYGQKNRLLPIWPRMARSPTITGFGWAPLIHAAFDVNRALFSPVPAIESYASCDGAFVRCADPYTPLPGLLAMHIRRGDFEEHCAHLAEWGAAFNGFNQFDGLPDTWTTPPGGGGGETTPENMALYMRRCFPSVEDIAHKVRTVLQSEAGRGLENLFIMTNAKQEWIDELKDALRRTGRWKRVASSRDLVLTKEQKYVAQAVDMLIGQRAQVLIGNGFSSMTSDIVMMRMARKIPLETHRFW